MVSAVNYSISVPSGTTNIYGGKIVGITTALSIAASALASNDSVNFTLAPEYSNDLHWQSNWFYDEIHNIGHLLYKSPGATVPYKHAIYNAITNTWSGPTVFLTDSLGHIWGSSALDTDTGDLYLQVYGEKFLRRWTYSTQSWDFSTSVFSITNTNTSPYGGLVYHPNLFGIGSGGMILDCGYGSQPIIGWNKNTNTWVSIKTNPTGTSGRAGVGSYFETLNIGIIGGNDQITSISTLVTNSTTHSAGAVFPIRLAGDSIATSSNNYGTILQHPGNTSKMIILQNGTTNTTGRKCYHSTNGVDWTQVGDHPFSDSEGGIFCSIPSLGIIWFIGRTNQSIIWRPPV